MKRITEETAVSISLVIAIAGLAFWLGNVSSTTEAHTIKIEKVSVNQDAFQREVIDRLARIEGAIEHRSRTSK